MFIKSSARLKYVSIPPRKMRLVGDMIKGMPVEKALNILNFTPKIAAHHLAKTLKSAAANALSAEGTDHLKPEDLVVKTVIVDAAPTAKRIRFQSMGRVFRYKKRFCHLTVNIEGEMEAPAPTKGAASKAKKSAAEDSADVAPKKQAKASSKAKKTVKKVAKKKTTAKKKTAAKTATKTAAKEKTATKKPKSE